MNAIAWVLGLIGFLFFNYFVGPEINKVINTMLGIF